MVLTDYCQVQAVKMRGRVGDVTLSCEPLSTKYILDFLSVMPKWKYIFMLRLFDELFLDVCASLF